MNVSRMPTAEEINALPQHVRDYIHWLATDADPASTLQRNYFLEQQNAQLQALLTQELDVVGGMHPKVTYLSNPQGPSRVQEEFLKQKCGTCEEAIWPCPIMGTRCACTPTLPTKDEERARNYLKVRLEQAVMQTQRSKNSWPELAVDNPFIRQLMYRAEADFHKASKGYLAKRDQGYVMGMFRNVLSAFANALTSSGE